MKFDKDTKILIVGLGLIGESARTDKPLILLYPVDENMRIKGENYPIGFKNISTLTPEKHDEIVGFLSHLTHCIAVALMISKESEHMCEYTGDSFRDLTRIAKINDVMWSELFMLNKTELLAQMKLFEAAFDRLRISIEQDDTDALREMMRLSAKRREYFDIK